VLCRCIPVFPIDIFCRLLIDVFRNEQHFTVSGRRVFDVWVQGAMAVNDLDLFATVGQNKAFIVDVTASADKAIEIRFESVKENPMISAIEILYQGSNPGPVPVPVPAPAPVPIPAPVPVPSPVAPTPTGTFTDLLINCGGGAYKEAAGVRTWKADQYFTGGGTYTRGALAISNTQDDTVYQSERNGAFNYEIPVPSGDYEIKLHFAEVSNPTCC